MLWQTPMIFLHGLLFFSSKEEIDHGFGISPVGAMFTIDPLGLGLLVPVRKVTLWFKFTSVIFKARFVHRSCLTADEMEVIIVVVFVAAAAISMRPLLFKKWMN